MNSPYAQMLNIQRDENSPGALCVIDPDDAAFGRNGVMHGGAVSSLLDFAGLTFIESVLAGSAEGPATATPLSTTVEFLRPARMERCHAEGRLVRLGGRVASIVVEAWHDDRTKPVAIARMTMTIAR